MISSIDVRDAIGDIASEIADEAHGNSTDICDSDQRRRQQKPRLNCLQQVSRMAMISRNRATGEHEFGSDLIESLRAGRRD
jgi:hypothetical protein